MPLTPAERELATEAAHSGCECHQCRLVVELTAELARAEERIRDLGGYLAAVLANHMAPNVVKLVAERGLALARGEAKETTVETTEPNADTTNDKAPERSEHTRAVRVAHFTGQLVPATLPGNPPKFTPKPGEWVKVESSPMRMDEEYVGKVGVIRKVDPSDEKAAWLFEADGEEPWWLHRDAVFAPAEQSAEPPAGEVSDEAEREDLLVFAASMLQGDAAAYAHGATVPKNHDLERRCYQAARLIRDLRHDHAGEVAALCQELEAEKAAHQTHAEALRLGLVEVTEALKAEKAAHAEYRKHDEAREMELAIYRKSNAALVDERDAALAQAQKPRPMPSREQMVAAISAALRAPVPTTDTRTASEAAADAFAAIEEVKQTILDIEKDLDRRTDSNSKRLSELELQGRVTRRLAAEIWNQRCQEDFRRTEDSGEALARIEREERERNK